MKHLQKFEAVLSGSTYDDKLERLSRRTFINQYQLNSMFSDMNIVFVDNDYVKRQFKCDWSDKNDSGFSGGFISVAVDNSIKENNYVVIVLANEPNVYLNSEADTLERKSFIKKLKEMIDHELVHREQYFKRGKNHFTEIFSKIKKFSNSSSKYYSNPVEIMAYAKTCADYLYETFGKDSLEMLRYGVELNNLKIYAQLDDETYKRFRKYVYQYISELI